MNAPTSSPSAPVRFAAARVTPNAAHAFGGVWRLTVRRYSTLSPWLVTGGTLAVLVLFAIGAGQSHDGARGYASWMARFYTCFLVPLLAFISGGGAMRDDLKADAVDYIFTRPVRRPAYVVFRYVAHLACAQLDFLLALTALTVVGLSLNATGVLAALPLILLAQVLVITAFTAFGFLAGALTSRYVIVGLLWGGVIEIGVGTVETQLSRLSLTRQVLGLLEPVTGATQAVSALGAPTLVVVFALFATVMVAATAGLFALKELAGASGRET